MTKRILSLCLVLVLLLGVLAGCSKNETKTDDTDPAAQTDAAPETTSQYAYQPQYFDLPEDIQWIGLDLRLGRHALLYRQCPRRRQGDLHR